VTGFSGAKYKKFDTRPEAEAYVDSGVVPRANSATHKPRNASPDIGSESGHDVVYCRGTCKGNGAENAVAGIGIWWVPGDSRNMKERCPGDQTNNRAEMLSIIRVLETAPNRGMPLLIKTDSNYACSGINDHMETWRENGYRDAQGQRLVNGTLFRYFYELREARRSTDQEVIVQNTSQLETCQGHEAAKKLSQQATSLPSVPERNWEELIEHCISRRQIMADASNSPVAGPSTNAVPTHRYVDC